ncbi:multidrug efflux system outer membrane protein [Chitinivorax tropicus]|uniref:Multidrug efflux system outer membrane protein n=1 Tax=Chitinivorax tropicus TaxID=714531 RepID=A0A840MGW0_9PROT|nr:efflux transporter outer membrane subunit [Chitinivorax tropicus]MBB5016765.1 multidrug efflux system outer membrane protein [Chitinivorax tropicus]
MKHWAPIALCGMVLGCNQMTPPQPLPTLPDQFLQPVQGTMPDANPWRMLGDPALSQWIEQVQSSNTELQAGLARLDAAKAELAGISAAQYPTLDWEHSVERRKQSKYDLGETIEDPKNPNNRHASQLVFGYELDLRGKIRAAIRAGEAEQRANRFDLQALRLSLARQTADLWLMRAELSSMARNIATQRALLAERQQVLQRKRQVGLLAADPLRDEARQLDELDLQALHIEQQRLRAERSLCQLAAQSHAGCKLPVGRAMADMAIPSIGTSVPAALLQRRPDLAAAQARYDAARARIDEAEAARWPALTLAGVLGVSAGNWAGLRRDNAKNWSLMPQIAAPLFDAGRRRAEVDQARSLAGASYAQWHGAIINAVNEVEDAAQTMTWATDTVHRRQSLWQLADKQWKAAQTSRRAGLNDGLQVRQAQLALLTAEQAQLTARREQLQASVALIAALGGGWVAEPVDQATSTTSDLATRVSSR